MHFPYEMPHSRNAVTILAWETAGLHLDTTFLSDSIFMFWIKFMQTRSQTDGMSKMHIFDTQFFTRLLEVSTTA
jgi:Ulp1 family protease